MAKYMIEESALKAVLDPIPKVLWDLFATEGPIIIHEGRERKTPWGTTVIVFVFKNFTLQVASDVVTKMEDDDDE